MRSARQSGYSEVMWMAVPLVRGKGGGGYRGAAGVPVFELQPVTAPPRSARSLGGCSFGGITDFKLKYKREPGYAAIPATLLDLKGISSWTRYDKSQLTRLVNKRKLPFLIFDGKKWFLLDDVERWFARQVTEGKVRGAQRGRIKFTQYCGNAGLSIHFGPPRPF